MSALFPVQTADSVHVIDYDALRDLGYTTIFFDVDDTLEVYTKRDPGERTVRLIRDLKEKGFRLLLLSNGREERVRHYAGILDVAYHFRARKPSAEGFRRALEKMGAQPQETVMIGDQIFTDVWGANRLGIRSIFVHPISYKIDELVTRWKRPAEWVVLLLYRWKKKKTARR